MDSFSFDTKNKSEQVKPIPKEKKVEKLVEQKRDPNDPDFYKDVPTWRMMLIVMKDDIGRMIGRPQRVFSREEREHRAALKQFDSVIRGERK